jgi:hypothetical protein
LARSSSVQAGLSWERYHPIRLGDRLICSRGAIGVTANLKPMESGVYGQFDLGRTSDRESGNLPTLVNAQFRGLYDRFHSSARATSRA